MNLTIPARRVFGPSFTFKVNDGSLNSPSSSLISITVEGANTSPCIGSILGQTIAEIYGDRGPPCSSAMPEPSQLVLTASLVQIHPGAGRQYRLRWQRG